MPITTALFLVSYAFGCLGALRYPLIGVITYLLVYLIYPATAWWSKPIAWMGIRYALVVSIFTAVGILLNWNRLGFGRRIWHVQEVLLALLVGAMWLSLFTGATPCDTSYVQVDKMTKVLIFALMMTHVVTTVRAYRLVTWSLIVGTFYLAYQSYTAGPASFMDGRLNLVGGPDFDRAPELGVHFAAILPFIAMALMTDTRWSTRAFLVLTAGLVCNGIVLTRTRSAMTAIIAAMAWALVQAPREWRLRIVGIGVIGSVGAFALTDGAFWERMGTISKTIEEQSSGLRDRTGKLVFPGRIPTWQASWAMWEDNPLGVGIGNFTRLIEAYPPANFPIDAHNTFVLCFAELGIFGITTLLAMVYVLLKQMRRLRRTVGATPGLRGLRLDIFALEASILTFFVGGLTVSRLYCEMQWCLMILPICLERAVANELRRARSRRPAEQAAWPETHSQPALAMA